MSLMGLAASKPRALPRFVLARENCKGVVCGRAWLRNRREKRSESSRHPSPQSLCRSPHAISPAGIATLSSAGALTPSDSEEHHDIYR